MAESQSEGSVVDLSALKGDPSPKLLVNGEEFSAFSRHDAALSHSSEEDEQKARVSHTDSENERKGSPEPFEPPSDELKEKIVVQVEQYLSDETLAKDAFLLKHVRRNKEGFVNLKLITSFKKVKSLTKDHRVVGEALKVSQNLSLNAEGTKVKRNEPLPAELLERNPGRTVVATRLENASFDSISEAFSKCGEIVLIRIIRPGKAVPSDLKTYFVKNPEMEKEVCAVIEFETMAAAARACSELTKENGMHVVDLGRAVKKEKVKAKVKSKDKGSDTGKDSEDEHEERGRRRRNRKNKDKRLQEVMGKRSDGSLSSSCSSDTDSSYSSFKSCRRRYNSGGSLPDSRLSPGTTRGSSQAGSWREPLSPQSSPELSRRRFADSSAKEGNNSAPNSPWSQRRKTVSPNAHLPGKSPLADSEPVRHRMVQLEGIQRLPKGPDGTRGFHATFGHGRTLLAVT